MIAQRAPSELTIRPPFSTLFPIDVVVRDAIARDMGANGFDASKPIDVWADGDGLIVIDGHTRIAAARSVGLGQVTTFERPFASELDALAHAIHNQRDRRNVRGADLVRAIKVYDHMLRQKPGGDRGNQYTGGKGSIDPLPENTSNQRSADVVAAALDISESTVKRARRIYDNPEAMAMVEQGASIYAASERSIDYKEGDARPGKRATQGPRIDGEPWFKAKDHGAICEATIGATLAEVNRRIKMADDDGLDLAGLIASDRRVGSAWRKALREARLLTKTIRDVIQDDSAKDGPAA